MIKGFFRYFDSFFQKQIRLTEKPLHQFSPVLNPEKKVFEHEGSLFQMFWHCAIYLEKKKYESYFF